MANSIRILYVDDELGLLEIAKLYLEESGEFSVTTIDSVSAALDLLGKEKFDVIISDYQMPDKDGIHFLVEVRTLFGTIPFILFTGKGREEVVIQAINSGVDFYLQKGGEPESQFAELSHKIKSAVLRKRSDEKFQTLYMHMIEGAALHELTYNDQGVPDDYVIIEANSAFEIHLDISRNTVIGKTSKEAYGVTDPPYLEIYARVALTGEPEVFETYFPPLAKYFSISAYCPYKGSFATVFEDITERKQTEMAHLKNAEELHAAYEELAATEMELRANLDELTRQEQAQRESEEKFRSLAESSPDYIMRYDRQCRHMYMNPAALRVSGQSEDKIIGKTHRETGFDESQSQFWEEKITWVFETGKSYQTQFVWDSVNGQVVLDWMLTPEFNDDGTVLSVLGVSRDITHLKKVEAELLKKNEELQIHQVELETQAEELRLSHLTLEESHDKFLDLYEFAPVGYLTLNDKALITEANLTSASLLGIERSKLVNHGLGRFIAPESHDEWDQYFVNIRQYGGKHTCNLTLIRGDDSLFSAWLEGIRLIDSQGMITIRIAISDVTERKHMEKDLRESEGQKKAILNGITSNIAFVDKDLKILWANKFAAESVNKTSAEMIGHTCHSLWADPSRPCENCPTLRVFETKQSEHTVMHTPDGRVWDERGEPVFDEKGNLIGVVEIAQDITEQKRVEEALRKSEEKFRVISDYTVNWESWFGPDGKYIWVSPSVAQFTGYSQGEILMMPNFISTVIAKEDRAMLTERFRKAIGGTSGGNFEFRFLHRDGSKHWLNVSWQPIVDLNGNFLGTRSSGHDITKRKLAEDALHESEQKFRDIFNTATDAIHICEIKDDTSPGRFIEINEVCLQMLGYSREEMLTKTPFDITTDYFNPPLEKILKDQKTTGAARFETEHRRKDGSIVPVELNSHVTTIQGKKVILGVARDITERKLAEEALIRSERLYHTLAESSPDMIFLVDNEGVIEYINPQAAKVFRYTPADLIGKRTDQAFPREIASHFVEEINLVIATKKLHFKEVLYQFTDGARWTSTRLVPITDPKGEVAKILGIATDITEYKRAEMAIRQISDRLSLATRAGGVGIWDYDVVNNTLTWDDQMLALYGITGEQFGGAYEAWKAGVHPDDRMQSDVEVQMALQGEKDLNTEFRVLWPDGSIRNIRALALVQRDASAKPLRMIGTNWDITPRKQVEEALRLANNKLNLLSGITRHDIKNKVTTIEGFLRFARKAKDIDEIQAFLDKIQDSAKAIEHQIDFTKDYQDLGVKSPRWLNLSNMIILASNPAIQIIDETGNLQIFADPLFEKVLHNLVDNTIRHGEAATEVHVFAITEQNDIRIIWTDNGIGVPAEEKDKIFHRGYGKNNGLGLFLIRKILEITGMTIQENGEPGKGVRFEITVPNGKWRYWNEASLFAADRFGRTHADIRK